MGLKMFVFQKNNHCPKITSLPYIHSPQKNWFDLRLRNPSHWIDLATHES